MAIRATQVPVQSGSDEGVLTAFEIFRVRFPDFVDRINTDRRDFHRRCQRLRNRSLGAQRNAVRQLLRMGHLYPIFAFDAIKAAGQLRQATPTSIHTLAEQFDPFNPIEHEPALLRNVSRSPARQRLACDFGPKRRMHQQVVDRILRNLHPPLENQYLFNGGMPMALGAIEAAISDGATHACEIDFVNFYGSVRFDDLAEVMRPLPASVTRHVVWDEHLRENDLFIRASDLHPSPTPETPNGIILGSASSPIVGEVLIARLLAAAQLPGIITYADNLFVFGRSEEEVDARTQALQEVLRNSPFQCVSGLRLHANEIRNVVDGERPSAFGIEFANHRALSREDGEGYRVTGWQPSVQKLADFQIGEADYVTVETLNRAITKVTNWRRYYRNWEDGDVHQAMFLASLKSRRFLKSPSPSHKASAVAAVTDAYVICNRGLQGDNRVPHTSFLPNYDRELDEEVRKRVEAIELALNRPRRPPPS